MTMWESQRNESYIWKPKAHCHVSSINHGTFRLWLMKWESHFVIWIKMSCTFVFRYRTVQFSQFLDVFFSKLLAGLFLWSCCLSSYIMQRKIPLYRFCTIIKPMHCGPLNKNIKDKSSISACLCHVYIDFANLANLRL